MSNDFNYKLEELHNLPCSGCFGNAVDPCPCLCTTYRVQHHPVLLVIVNNILF